MACDMVSLILHSVRKRQWPFSRANVGNGASICLMHE